MPTTGGPLAWLVTGWFAILGGVSLLAAVRQRGWQGRVSWSTHVLMCIAMATMPWPWSMNLPTIASIMMFSAGALWYVGLANFGSTRFAAPYAGHHTGSIMAAYHAVMMAAMVWMAVLMSSAEGASDHDMPGMEMAGSEQTATHLASGMSATGWGLATSLGFAVVFAAASLGFIIQLVRLPPATDHEGPLPPVAELLLNLGMALGMGGSMLALA